MVYKGPVLFIVHPAGLYSDKKTDSLEGRQIDASRKKIEVAVKKAAMRGIPVVYERFEIMSGLRLGKKEERRFIDYANSLNPKPKLIESNIVTTNIALSEFEKVRLQLLRKGIAPSRFTLMGIYREKCVTAAAVKLAIAFPKAKIHLVEGSSTVSYKSNHRQEPRKAKVKFPANIKRTKKLIPARHFAK